jgi:hypothetical protein
MLKRLWQERRSIFWWGLFVAIAMIVIMAGVGADDKRCYAKGGHWTAHGFGLCVNANGQHI